VTLDALDGIQLDTVRARSAPEKVAEYVAATGDDPERWIDVAPPSYAGALLFMAAPLLLERDDVRAHTKVLVHVDQRFVWHGPLDVGTDLRLLGTVSKVRSRGASTFVTFEVAATSAAGPLLDSTSTFLLGEEPAAEPGVDRGEPPAPLHGPNEVPSRVQHAGAGSVLPSLAKSASRVDLVRYAGASGDFNPIHYDHEAARGAGLDGIVVHGLLMGAWMAQLAAATSSRPDPLAELRLRFRAAMRPAISSTVKGVVNGERVDGLERVDLAVVAEDVELVTGHATVRVG
jgi:acyl dehydratase